MFKCLKKILNKTKKIKCDHHGIEMGSKGRIADPIHYFKCNKCGLYCDNNIMKSRKNKNNYIELMDLYFNNQLAVRDKDFNNGELSYFEDYFNSFRL
ncbi:Zn finger protein [Bacillus phage AR9]|uniref:Zn finger protein n=2 Tax=Bacillus phage PBS1 TaxID=10683 RepID=A0A172JI80_BPPB1|nr:zinc-finger domain protein [Bacillus phage AR9]YP_009664262.1 zinc-finger domain protein [Bacillus phage PBS1]AMS01256.1 Zn finger protein [Bacillus phage AR9]AST99882.1 hypothetical protein PBI_PBS1_60 [Bacillus phage PBS1]BDE75298.1 hypothetical protein [Bacillus phage PBS1]